MPQTNQSSDISKIWENEFVVLSEAKNKPIGIAKAKQEYIPIEEFKEAFLQAKDYAKEKKWKQFVFDKSKLNVFHQPSMAWYYTEWKTDLVELGLIEHFKILPQEPWFKTSVDAGIIEIKENHPDFDFNKFKVKYINSLSEVLET
ncbi:MAG: hypothetical protein RIC95_05010 [Vicingaceae bacterium]